jgi:DNA-binding GntR family transcriptional regulator
MADGGNIMVMGNKSQMIADILWQKISSGECSGRLPAEQELARQFAVSPVTASKALNILRDKGIVTRMARQGTFVIPREKRHLKIRFPEVTFERAQVKHVNSTGAVIEFFTPEKDGWGSIRIRVREKKNTENHPIQIPAPGCSSSALRRRT